jgi:ubiquitin carboxyl-terminal hydrolase 36/42
LESTNSSAAVNKKDASSIVPSSEIYPKDAPFQQNNRQKLLKVHPALETSSAPLTFPSKGAYLANSELRECLPPSTPSMNSNNVTPKPEETSTITEAKTSDCNVPSNSSSCLKNSAIDKLVRNEIPQKVIGCFMPSTGLFLHLGWHFHFVSNL